ncbi:MAG: hypothetical protein JW904_12265 [Spirochaetales bacterium]|nr:hypothetical protein [Spirochaetales bacterium]
MNNIFKNTARRAWGLVFLIVSFSISAEGTKTADYSKIKFDLTVAKDGSGTQTTVQAAIDAVPDNSKTPVFILVKNGIYREVVNVNSAKRNIRLLGENVSKTIITFDNYHGKLRADGSKHGTTGSSTVFIYGNGFYAENITFENSTDESTITDDKQAVSIRTEAEELIFKNCRFIGNQDTVFTRGGRQYFENCYIEGDVDFIFGDGPAWFEQCEIKSLDRPGSTKGYLTAASTPERLPFGLVFSKCKLTAAEGVTKNTVFLGRAWHPSSYNEPVRGSTVFLFCEMGEHIKTVGWTYMDGKYPVKSERLREYKSTGPGGTGIHSNRIQLTDDEAKEYTLKNVLGGKDNWDPKKPVY